MDSDPALAAAPKPDPAPDPQQAPEPAAQKPAAEPGAQKPKSDAPKPQQTTGPAAPKPVPAPGSGSGAVGPAPAAPEPAASTPVPTPGAPEPDPIAAKPVPAPGVTGPFMDPHPPSRRPGRPAALLAGLLLVVPALVTACRLLDTDGITPVPQLLSFLPWLTVPAGLGLLLAAVARRRGLALTAVVVLATTAWSSLPYTTWTTIGHGLPVARVRVLAANVEFGQATDALIATIRRERPALVYVSECDRACGRALTTAFTAELPHYASVEADGSAGSVLLSAHPLRDWRMIPATMGMPGATAEIAGRSVRVQLAHPMPPLPGQVDVWKRELGRIEDFAALRTGPTLIAGDFNASQDHAAFRAILKEGRLRDAAWAVRRSRAATWPVEGPVPPYVQIDHVLVSDEFSVDDVRFLDLDGTDHRAVLADLDLRGDR
ncbi:endonuclease/exonuclease/phosphatase family protein [Streptomyces sp. NPDC090109]|uniref:endonuclease/exonuclease/phosphatase family protein n=1 Tax=Streptomyces sp. NPDC090109 TaxID=3365948 RepID=UPI0038093F5A